MSFAKKHICLAEDDPDDYYIFARTLEEFDKSIKLTCFTTYDGGAFRYFVKPFSMEEFRKIVEEIINFKNATD